MSRRLPPLNAIRAFEAAARLGSVKQAAEELYVTPSAVSHQLKSLEDFLGVDLFRRSGRQIGLTAAGERYRTSVTHALDEVELATRRVMAAAIMIAPDSRAKTPSARKTVVSMLPFFCD